VKLKVTTYFIEFTHGKDIICLCMMYTDCTALLH